MRQLSVKTVIASHRARLLIAVFIASLLAIPACTTAVLHAAGTVETSVNVSASAVGLSEAPQISLNENLYAITWGERATNAVGTADGALTANPGARQVLVTGTSTKTQFPDIAVGADGTEHLAYASGNDIFYRHRTLGGTWANAVKVASDTFPNPVRMAVAPNGTIWIIWRDTDGTHIGFRFSTNGGASWSGGTGGIVYAEIGNMFSFDIAVGTDNVPHVVWYIRTTGANKGEIEYADWDGSRFNQGKLTNDGSALYDADPVIAIDGNNVQHVAWRKQVGTGDTLYYAERSAGGNWGGFTPLAESGATFQYAPGIGTDTNGSIYITFSQLLNGGRSVYIAAKPTGQAAWNPVEVISDGYHNWETRSGVAGSTTGGTKAHIVYQSETRSDETTGEIYYKRVLYGPGGIGPSAQPQIEASAKTTKNNPVQVTFAPIAGGPTQVRWKWGAAPTDQNNDSAGWQPFPAASAALSITLPSDVTPTVCRNLTLYTQVQNSATSEATAKSTSILYDAATQASVGVRNPHLDSKLATYSQGASDGAQNNTRESYYDVTITDLADCSGLKAYGFDSGASSAWPSSTNQVVQRNTIPATYDPGVRPPLPTYVIDQIDNRTDQGAVVVYDPRNGKLDSPVANSGAPVVSGGTFTVDTGNSVLRTLSFSGVKVNDTVYGVAASLPTDSQFWGVWVATSKGTAPITDTNSDTLQWAAIKVAQPGASFTIDYPLLTGQPTGALTGRAGTYWIYVKFLDGAGNPSVETLPAVQVDLKAGYSLITQKLPTITR